MDWIRVLNVKSEKLKARVMKMNNDFDEWMFAVDNNSEFSFLEEFTNGMPMESEAVYEIMDLIDDMEKNPNNEENIVKMANIIAKTEHAEIVKIGKFRCYTNKEFADMLNIDVQDIAYDKDLDEGENEEFLQELTKEESDELNKAVSNTIADWLTYHGHDPNFGEIIEIKTFTFECDVKTYEKKIKEILDNDESLLVKAISEDRDNLKVRADQYGDFLNGQTLACKINGLEKCLKWVQDIKREIGKVEREDTLELYKDKVKDVLDGYENFLLERINADREELITCPNGDNDFFHVRYFALEISDYGNGLECVEDIKSKIEEIEKANKNE